MEGESITRKDGRRRAAARLQRVGLAVVALSAVIALASALAWSAYEGRVRSAFDEARSHAPSRLYSRPLALRVGERIDREFVEAHLRAAGYVRLDPAATPPGRGGPVGSPSEPADGPAGDAASDAATDAGTDAAARGAYHLGDREWWIAWPTFRLGDRRVPSDTLEVRLDAAGRIAAARDASGSPLQAAWLARVPLSTVLDAEGRDRLPVRLHEVPEHLVHAVLVVEDRRFHRHGGLDLWRTIGALWVNLRAGRVEQGGSTLTQQLARTLFLDRDRTLARKAKEAVLAVALERRASKREILEAYLNHVYLGHVDGVAVHGVGRAAQLYFGRDVSELEPHQSALLAGMIRAPNLYSPHRDPEGARSRRELAVRRMAAGGFLDARAASEALAAPLRVRPMERERRVAPYFTDLAEAELRSRVDPDPGRAGLAVLTSLVPGLQAAAERTVREGLEEIERAYPYQVGGEETLQAALVALDPSTGEVVALVGGRDYGASQFNRASAARRQPGSVFKPVVALAALYFAPEFESGHSLASTFADEPITVETDEGPWSPANYDGQFRGPVSLRLALVASRNLPFVRLGLDLGPTPIIATARAMGIRSHLRPVPSLALGSSEVTLLEMTAAYAVLAAEGVRAETRTIVEVRHAAGAAGDRQSDSESSAGAVGAARATAGAAGGPTRPAPGPEWAARPQRVFPAEPVRQLTSALEGVVQSGTGRGVRERGYRGPVAAKSGTTDNYRDAWFVGYTSELAVGVWAGFDSGASLGIPGNVAALPIFTDFLRAALQPDGRAAVPLAGGTGDAVGSP